MMQLAVLGVGYTGSLLLRLAQERGLSCYGVSRRPASNKPGQEVRDLLVDGIMGLPEAENAVITFPLPVSGKSLLDECFRKYGRIVYLNTTGVYAEESGAWVDEGSPTILAHERLIGEALVLERGGVVLRLAGLYGPGRSPLSWVRRGMLKKTATWLNLIHGEDVAKILLELLDQPSLPRLINVSDGQPLNRLELFSGVAASEFLQPVAGKRVCIDLLRSLLPSAWQLQPTLRTIHALGGG